MGYLRSASLAFLLLFSSLGAATTWAAEPTYTMTETELTELETIFSRLKTQQEEQKNLLTTQQSQIETLKIQLKTSETQINNSKTQLKTVQEKLNAANKSLAEYASEVKRERQRLERQRDTWAVAAAIALGYAIARR